MSAFEKPLDGQLFEEVFAHLHLRGVPYLWGGKAHPLTVDTSAIAGLDCSGFAQYEVARCSGQQVIWPEGSAEQHDWCEAAGLHKLLRYSDVHFAADDSRLFVAFIRPVEGVHAGHVWFVRHGWTRESHSHVGVSSRPWDTPVLLQGATDCYELPVK